MSTYTLLNCSGAERYFFRFKIYLVGFTLCLGLFWCLGFSDTSFAASKQIKSTAKTKSVSKKVAKKPHTKIKKKTSIKSPKSKRAKPVSQGVQAKAAYCINLANNETLISKNADEKLPIASLTKLVTALVTLDHMPLDKEITVPDHIKKVPKSVVGLNPGDTLTVNDLLHGLLISSGNDCAETLACAFPGGKEKFIEALNKKAHSLGATKTQFFTPSGLDKKIGSACSTDKDTEIEANVSTAREIGSIAKVAFSNNIIRSICLKKSFVLASKSNPKGYSVRSTNKLLRDNLPVVAGKTGFTVRAGHCLASEFSPGKDLFVIVVLGSPNHFRDTRLLYRMALRQANGGSLKSVAAKRHSRIAAK
ncbi:MAG: serine hydrolase [Deltaproteobacteria bacterium]|nr:serine hydrolase [Deltaproteobacteria bacterium]